MPKGLLISTSSSPFSSLALWIGRSDEQTRPKSLVDARPRESINNGSILRSTKRNVDLHLQTRYVAEAGHGKTGQG